MAVRLGSNKWNAGDYFYAEDFNDTFQEVLDRAYEKIDTDIATALTPVVSNVTGSRTWSTEYTNDSYRVLWVIVSLAQDGTTASYEAYGYIGETSATTKVAQVNFPTESAGVLIFAVPYGWKYKITRNNGTYPNEMPSWVEIGFGPVSS